MTHHPKPSKSGRRLLLGMLIALSPLVAVHADDYGTQDESSQRYGTQGSSSDMTSPSERDTNVSPSANEGTSTTNIGRSEGKHRGARGPVREDNISLMSGDPSAMTPEERELRRRLNLISGPWNN